MQAAPSLSARRAWIEIFPACKPGRCRTVALRKESVDRNVTVSSVKIDSQVALRKESVDRNGYWLLQRIHPQVALRKESVDRNFQQAVDITRKVQSLSARRAWIEMTRARLGW